MRYLKDVNSPYPAGLTTNIIEELMEKGVMSYQHTLQPNLPTVENALGQYYKLILKWKADDKKSAPQNENSLKTLLAGFHYIFDHLMPYERGSGAGAEWATRALAQLKGYDLTLKENVRSVVQEDLAQPNLTEFIGWYKAHVDMNKISSLSSKK